MTTRPLPRIPSRCQPSRNPKSLAPSETSFHAPDMRNLAQRPGRVQTFPPTSEEAIGVYAYLDEENFDDSYLTRTLEAIESGEFSKVPEAILNWYNSLDSEELAHDGADAPEHHYYSSDCFEVKETANEYIDPNEGAFSPDPPEESIKRNKRFLGGDRMNVIKDRLSQFLAINFKGIKKNSRKEVPNRKQTSSVSEPIEKYCAGVLITSNSFDDSTSSLDYIEHPKRRSSTEAFIPQIPNSSAPPGNETWHCYLENYESNKHRNLTRKYSKSLQDVSIPLNLPSPSQPKKLSPNKEDPYLAPIKISFPVPPPRISSRPKDIMASKGKSFDSNLTQDYIEPKVLIETPFPKTSIPTRLVEIPRVKVPHPRTYSAGSKLEYILPEDTPLTPMPRFNKQHSVSPIPVLSYNDNYSDPLDFNIQQHKNLKSKSPHTEGSPPKPMILPKPFLPKSNVPTKNHLQKPIPPPKPRGTGPPVTKRTNLKFQPQTCLTNSDTTCDLPIPIPRVSPIQQIKHSH